MSTFNKSKSLIQKLIRTGFIHIFGSNVLNQIIVFLSGILIVRIIPKSDYGVYSYANNIFTIIMLFSGMGMGSGVLQLCSEKYNEPENARAVFQYGLRTGFRFNLLLCLVVGLITVILPLPVSGANSLLQLMMFLPLFMIVFELMQAHFRYQRLNKTYSYLNTANTAGVFIFSIVGSLLWRARGLIIFRYGAYALTLLLGITAFQFPLRSLKEKTFISKRNKIDLLKISVISMFNNASGQLLYLLDVFFVGLLIPVSSTIASYKISTVIPNAMNFIPGSLMVYLYPYFAEHINDKKWVRNKFLSTMKYIGLFNLVLTAVLILFAPFVIRIVFGSSYWDAIASFRILMVAYFISGTFRKIAGNLLVTQRKLKFNFWMGIFEGVINIIGNVILIQAIGYIGASIVTLIISTLSSVISVTYFLKVVK